MAKLTVEEVLDILKQEIEWCEEHADKPFPSPSQVGFMSGLRQARNLILTAEFSKALTDEE